MFINTGKSLMVFSLQGTVSDVSWLKISVTTKAIWDRCLVQETYDIHIHIYHTYSCLIHTISYTYIYHQMYVPIVSLTRGSHAKFCGELLASFCSILPLVE